MCLLFVWLFLPKGVFLLERENLQLILLLLFLQKGYQFFDRESVCVVLVGFDSSHTKECKLLLSFAIVVVFVGGGNIHRLYFLGSL